MASNEGVSATRALTPAADIEDINLKDTNNLVEAPTGEKNSSEEQREGFTVDNTTMMDNGSIDPVYEAKARVLNNAVSSAPPFQASEANNPNRSKKSAWDGTNGSSSSS